MCRRFLYRKHYGWIFTFLLWEYGQASTDIKSFDAYTYIWNAVLMESKKSETMPATGSDVQLNCTFSDTITSQNFKIRRLDQDIQLNQTYDMSTHSLSVTLTNVQCDQQGTYVCENGTQKEMLDLGITDCGPRLCKPETSHTIVYAKINETKNFSVCIVERNKTKLLYIDNITVREDETSAKWAWNSKSKEKNNFRQYLSFTFRNVSIMDYRTYNINLTTLTTGTINKEVVFYIEFKRAATPECPSDIKVTSQGTDFVTLSWHPGDPGADSQWFYVHYNCGSCGPWKNRTTGVGETSVTISDLIENKHYIVRVEPHNSENLVNTTCQILDFNTAVTTAAPAPKSTTSTTFTAATAPPAQAPATTPTPKDKKSDSTDDTITSILPIIIILGVLAILAVPVAILGICMYCRLKRVYSNLWNPEISRSRRNVRYIPEGSLQTTPTEPVNESLLSNQSSDNRSGRSVSQDGLIYVTVDHSNHHGRHQTNPSTRKGDKVEYAGLDYKYSGRLPMSCSDDTYVNC